MPLATALLIPTANPWYKAQANTSKPENCNFDMWPHSKQWIACKATQECTAMLQPARVQWWAPSGQTAAPPPQCLGPACPPKEARLQDPAPCGLSAWDCNLKQVWAVWTTPAIQPVTAAANRRGHHASTSCKLADILLLEPSCSCNHCLQCGVEKCMVEGLVDDLECWCMEVDGLLWTIAM